MAFTTSIPLRMLPAKNEVPSIDHLQAFVKVARSSILVDLAQ
jgi:hypothetical protein